MHNGHKNRKANRSGNDHRGRSHANSAGKRRNGMTHMKSGHTPSARLKG